MLVLLSTQNLDEYFNKEIEIFEKSINKSIDNETFQTYEDLNAIPMLEEEILQLSVKIEKMNSILHCYNTQKISNESESTLK